MRVQSVTRKSAIDDYVTLFRSAIQKRLPEERFVLPLSGGRDSRHILFQLCALGRPPAETLTGSKFPPEPQDFAVAENISARAGVNHRRIGNRSDLQNDIIANPLQSFCADQGSWLLPVADYLRRNTNVTYDGIAGDVLTALYPNRTQTDLCSKGDFEALAIRAIDARRGYLLRESIFGKRYSRDAAIARIT